FFFQAEDGIRDWSVTGVQTCALPICWPWLGAHPGLVLAGALALAGGFQFTPLKERCLTACRDPMSMLWQHYRRGPAGAWRLGTQVGRASGRGRGWGSGVSG